MSRSSEREDLNGELRKADLPMYCESRQPAGSTIFHSPIHLPPLTVTYFADLQKAATSALMKSHTVPSHNVDGNTPMSVPAIKVIT